MSRFGRFTAAIKIISNSNTLVNGIPANRGEWAKRGFTFPKVGMVGEVMNANGIQVLKICDNFYVPFSGEIEEVSEAEFLKDRYSPNSGEYTSNSIEHELDYLKKRYMGKKAMSPSLMESRINFIYRDTYLTAKSNMGREADTQIRSMTSELEALPIYDFKYEDAVEKFAQLITAEFSVAGINPDDEKMVSLWVGLHAESYVKAMESFKSYEFKTVFRDIYKAYLLSQ